MDKTILSELSTEQEKSNQRVGGAAMKNKWGRRIGVFALAAISSALMFSTNAITAKAADNEWTYNYTGGVQSWTVPYNGKYMLEVWGAQGGNDTHNSGGLGGYGCGKIALNEGDVLYIVIGGTNGYNGGGTSTDNHDAYGQMNIYGGGASHIATTNRGVLANYVSNKSEVLIVAGGGGGAGFSSEGVYRGGYGGSGGGTNGGNGGSMGEDNSIPGAGGAQNDGYAFGRGASLGGYYAGPGGGGWYGGKSGYNRSGGGGGSGYVNTGKLTDGSMANGVRLGNGYVKITALHTHTYTSKITTNPTCTKDGIRTYTCTGSATDAACGHQYTEIIPKLNHDCFSHNQTNAQQINIKHAKLNID